MRRVFIRVIGGCERAAFKAVRHSRADRVSGGVQGENGYRLIAHALRLAQQQQQQHPQFYQQQQPQPQFYQQQQQQQQPQFYQQQQPQFYQQPQQQVVEAESQACW